MLVRGGQVENSRAFDGPSLVGRPWVGSIEFYHMDRRPVRPIKFSSGGPHIEVSEDGPRPGSSHFQKFTARPGTTHQFFKYLGPGRPGP